MKPMGGRLRSQSQRMKTSVQREVIPTDKAKLCPRTHKES